MEKVFSKLEHGGSVRKGRRKIARAFDRRRALHVTMRAIQARGRLSFMHSRNKARINVLLLDLCERYEAKLYCYRNVGNHIHLAIQFRTKRQFQAFLKVFTQGIMFLVTGARKGKPFGKFFDEIAYSRVVNWGPEFKRLLNYLWKNLLESLGFSREQIAYFRRMAKEVPL